MFLEIMAIYKKSASELCEDVQKKYGKSVYLRKDIAISEPVNKPVFAGSDMAISFLK